MFMTFYKTTCETFFFFVVVVFLFVCLFVCFLSKPTTLKKKIITVMPKMPKMCRAHVSFITVKEAEEENNFT